MPIPDLSQWLTTLDAPQLERITTLRPDVLLGAPVRDLPDLADRLTHPASVASVVRELPAPALKLLEALVALGSGATRERAADLLHPGPRDGREQVDAVDVWAQRLAECALAWPDGAGRQRLSPGVRAVMHAPLGLGRPGALVLADVPAQELQKVARRWGLDVPKRKAELVDAVLEVLGDGEAVRRLVGEAPPGIVEVLLDRARHAAGRFCGGEVRVASAPDLPRYPRDQAAFGRYRVASAWAVENGLAYGPWFDPVHAELPSEVLLALAPPEVRAPFAPDPPHVPTAPVAQTQVDAAAAGAVTELLSAVMATLEHLTRTPVPILKAGGVGARELTRLAKAVGAGPADVRLALELGLALDLFEPTENQRLGTNEAFDGWRALPPARRAADLLQAWANTRFVPTADRDAEGASVPALTRFDAGDASVATRAVVLGLLGELADGVGVTSVDAVVEAVTWQLPIVVGWTEPDVVRPTLAEAERLGLVALGRLTAVGERMATVGTTEALVETLSAMLPAVQTRAVVGSDLTVMVLGSPAPELVDLLDAVAQREARGQASTWRVTPVSLRGALDAGYRADDVLAALRRAAGGKLPQALEYLVGDVARRHGHLHVAPASAVIVGSDEALVAEVAAHRSLRRLGLRAVAPTVLVASTPLAEVLDRLRDAGYLPVEVGADGAPVVSLRRLPRGDDGPRDRASSDAPAPEPAATDDADPTDDADRTDDADPTDDADAALARWAAETAGSGTGPSRPASRPPVEAPADVVARLLRGEPPPHADESVGLADALGRQARRLARVEVEQLAHAVVHRLPVRIRYRSRSGSTSVRVVSDLEVQGGHLVGWCHLRADLRRFALDSLLGVIAEPA